MSYSVDAEDEHRLYNDILFGYRCNPSVKEIALLESALRKSRDIPDIYPVFIWFWTTVSYDINVE